MIQQNTGHKKTCNLLILNRKWWAWTDSNCRPADYESCVLPIYWVSEHFSINHQKPC